MARPARILLALSEAETRHAAAVLHDVGFVLKERDAVGPLAHDLSTFRPDLVVIDFPAGDPASLTTAVCRTHAAYRPMVLCTVDGPSHWVLALEAGADAHLQKPYRAHELRLTVTTLLRRAPWLLRTVRQVAGLVVDEAAHVVLVDDDPIVLSKKEFGIIAVLARHPGVIVSKRTLLEELWGYDAYDENLVEVHVCSLRRRLPPSGRRLVQTVRGMGYVLREDDAQVADA